MKWAEEKLKKLAEINSEKKIPRYFAIKDFVEECVQEEHEAHTKDALP